MKILLVHCRYRQRGGEDTVFDAESRQLLEAGHDVTLLEFPNDELRSDTLGQKLGAAVQTVWSFAAANELRKAICRVRPAVVHFHNTFPRLSPRAYVICAEEGVPAVQTLHNYRLLCANAMFVRSGAVCEDCANGRYYRGVVHACYRDSRAASAAVAAMQYVHHGIGTFTRKVTRYVALTEFARERFVQGGLPAERIVVKPNSLARDPGVGGGEGNYLLFVGRLSAEKGLRVLLDAWRALGPVPLRIAGDGPLRADVEEAARALGPHVEVLGAVGPDRVYELMQRARGLLVPSLWYEGFPMTVIESYACGTPVFASRIGSLTEIVLPGTTGASFAPGDSGALAELVSGALGQPDQLAAMRAATRAHYESRFTPAHNLAALEAIYTDAVAVPAAGVH